MRAGLVMPLAAAAEDVASDAEHTVELGATRRGVGAGGGLNAFFAGLHPTHGAQSV